MPGILRIDPAFLGIRSIAAFSALIHSAAYLVR